ncbi:SDR family NAD(P)-dependent oxidoreductase [Brevibacillus choshinensis]|uniref:SDR family NAD(P)-dependent oxidoreductase n=1 Tax=Brevibacillus choshinensis TaxID=54911 RepID=UPI001EEF6B35|nr:SDR family NAD(P)-dependent oxidoreductase [Brevibacillus choshinensis]
MHIHQSFGLKGKVALVTGGGRGLGEHIAKAFAEAGAEVVVCSHKLDNCQQIATELEEMGVRNLALECDVSKAGRHQQDSGGSDQTVWYYRYLSEQ